MCFQVSVLDELDPIVLVLHRTVSARDFHEGGVVDARGGCGDLCGDVVVFGDQCGGAECDSLQLRVTPRLASWNKAGDGLCST